jgi:hypothetical protein
VSKDTSGAKLSATTNDTDTTTQPELTKPTGTLYEQEFWAIQRHELIAAVADELIGTKARTEVRRILEPLDIVELSQIAGWADTVKRRRPQPDDDDATVEFLEDDHNRANDTWHYVNTPLDAEEYSPERYPDFTRDDDVVQTINTCVSVLKGTSDRFSEVNALRLLTHLVGDVHQPVHCGCCYIDDSGAVARLVRDPVEIVEKQLEHDQGGNRVILPVGTHGVSIHSYWDSRLGGSNPNIHDPEADGAEGDAAADAEPPELKEKFVTKLLNMIAEDPSMAPNGEGEADASPVEQWAATWATDSLITARSAYETLTITGTNEQDERKYDVSWTSREDYDQRCKPLVIERMKLASRNLAKMLDTIWA